MITKLECKVDVQNQKFGWVLFQNRQKNKVKFDSKLIKCFEIIFLKIYFSINQF